MTSNSLPSSRFSCLIPWLDFAILFPLISLPHSSASIFVASLVLVAWLAPAGIFLMTRLVAVIASSLEFAFPCGSFIAACRFAVNFIVTCLTLALLLVRLFLAVMSCFWSHPLLLRDGLLIGLVLIHFFHGIAVGNRIGFSIGIFTPNPGVVAIDLLCGIAVGIHLGFAIGNFRVA